jgi:hypothetical protein
MMKRPFETIREHFFENLDELKQNQRYNFANSDKFMVWVVGFSIGGLSIIVTQITQFNQSFSHLTIKATLILLSCSIISGLIYRWSFYMWQVQYQNFEFYLQVAFSSKEIMEIEPFDLTNENDIKEIVRRMKIDFGEDVSFVLQDYEKADDKGKEFLLNDLKMHYKKVGDWARVDYENGVNYVKDIYKSAFGISEKRINKMFKQSSTSKLKFYSWITAIAFLLSCTSFITVVIILCVAY